MIIILSKLFFFLFPHVARSASSSSNLLKITDKIVKRLQGNINVVRV